MQLKKIISKVLIGTIVASSLISSGISSVKAAPVATSKFVSPVSPVQCDTGGFTCINTTQQLDSIRTNLSGKYRLGSNLTIGSNNFSPIGDGTNPFTGQFDGNGFVISELNINNSNTGATGLFAYTSGATISNIGIENASVLGKGEVGGLIGEAVNTTIQNTYVTGTEVNSDDLAVGGLVGAIKDTSISNSFTSINVISTSPTDANAGGLVGSTINTATSNTIQDSYATGNVIASKNNAGGLVGYTFNTNLINTFASGNVSAPISVGGLIGNAHNVNISKSFTIGKVTSSLADFNAHNSIQIGGLVGDIKNSNVNDSFSNSSVEGYDKIGGLFGQSDTNTIANNYYAGQIVGTTNVGGLVGIDTATTTSTSYWDKEVSAQATSPVGIGKRTVEMKQEATYTGMDFVNTWVIDENNDYPRLKSLVLSTPQNLAATELMATSVKLAWDIVQKSAYYIVKRDGTVVYTGANNFFTDSALASGSTHTYTVTASNGNAQSLPATLSVTLDNTAPAEVTNIQETHTANTANLTFTLPNDSDFKKVKIYRNNSYINDSLTGTFNDTNLSDGTTFTYKITTVDIGENESNGATINVTTTVDTIPPSDVTGVQETHTDHKITLTWVNPTDSDFSHIKITRNGTVLANNVTTSNYVDDNLVGNTNYSYKLIAVDTANNESTGVTQSVITNNDNQAPAEVTNLSETHDSQIMLSWTNPVDQDLKSIKIYKNNILLTTLGNNLTTYTDLDKTLESGKSYSYKVTTVDTSNNESAGATVNVAYTYKVPEITGLTETHIFNSVQLKWTNPTDSKFSKVNIYRDTVKIGTSTNGTYKDTNLKAETAYVYILKVENIYGMESAGTTLSVTTAKGFAINDGVIELKDEAFTTQLVQGVKELTLNYEVINSLLTNNTTPIKAIKIPKVSDATAKNIKIDSQTIQKLNSSKVNVIIENNDSNIYLNNPLNIDYNTKTLSINVKESSTSLKKFIAKGGNVEYSIKELTTSGSQVSNSKSIYNLDIIFPNNDNSFIFTSNSTTDGFRYTTVLTDMNKVSKLSLTKSNLVFIIGKYDLTFSDIANDWSKANINDLVSKGYINGYEDGTFKPQQQITRAEFVAMLVNALGLTLDNSYTSKFSDVETNKWYYNSVKIAENNNLIEGDNNKFKPDAMITRQEAIAIIVRALETKNSLVLNNNEGINLLSKYKDHNKISPWASDTMAKAVKYKVVEGNNDNTITPQNSIKRNESAALIKRFIDFNIN